MVPLVMPARAAMSSIRVPAKPFSAKQASAASRISGARSSLRRVQRWLFTAALITDQSVISSENCAPALERHLSEAAWRRAVCRRCRPRPAIPRVLCLTPMSYGVQNSARSAGNRRIPALGSGDFHSGMTQESNDQNDAEKVGTLLATPDLAGALESEQFRRFLDQVPIAIVLSEIKSPESIVYANPEYEKVSGQAAAQIVGKPWSILECKSCDADTTWTLGEAIVAGSDFVGTFTIDIEGRETEFVDAYSNIIEDDDGTPAYRFVALVRVSSHKSEQREE